MDKNGYNDSLIQRTHGSCYLCHRTGNTQRHEIFNGSLRQVSKALGLWCELCDDCHYDVTNEMHWGGDETYNDHLKAIGERVYREHYSVSFEKFKKGALKHWEIEKLVKEYENGKQHR